MFDIFVCKTLASRALCQAYTFSQSSIICLAVRGVQTAYRVPTLDTYRHCSERQGCSKGLADGVGSSRSDSINGSKRRSARLSRQSFSQFRRARLNKNLISSQLTRFPACPFSNPRQWLWQHHKRRRSVLCQGPSSTPRRLADLAVLGKCSKLRPFAQTRLLPWLDTAPAR